MNKQIIYFTLPSSWKDMLLKGDCTSLSEKDIGQIRQFLTRKNLKKSIGCSNLRYAPHHDAKLESTTVLDYAFEVLNES